MYNTHQLLEHISRFTSLRDRDLLILSLMKTISSFMQPNAVSMVRINNKGNPVQEIRYNEGNYDINYDELKLQNEVDRAINNLVDANTDEYTVASENEYITVFLLCYDRRCTSYLVLHFPQRISKVESYHVRGMVDIYQNFTQLLNESQTDELTGLANRKTFDEAVSSIYDVKNTAVKTYQEEKRHSSDDTENVPFWIAIIDIDHFKKINDTFGHLYGDEVLVHLAQLMKNFFREDDMLFRFGGEEFVIILRNPTRESCYTAMERFRKAVEENDFPGVGQVTISTGVTEMLRGVFHVTLLDYADQALYFSKENGRNKVTFFDELLESGKARIEKTIESDVDLF